LIFLFENIASHCIVKTRVLDGGKRAGIKTAVLKYYPVSAEDGADKML